MNSTLLLFSNLPTAEQIILCGVRTWANNIRLNKDPIPALRSFYKTFHLDEVSILMNDFMTLVCIGYRVQLDLRCNCNMIISNHEQILLETFYYSQIHFRDLEKYTLRNIVKDKYISEVMVITKTISKAFKKNAYEFKCSENYFKQKPKYISNL